MGVLKCVTIERYPPPPHTPLPLLPVIMIRQGVDKRLGRGVRSGVGSPQSGVGQQGAMGKVNLYTRNLDVRVSGAGRCVYRWSGMGAGYRVYGAVCVREGCKTGKVMTSRVGGLVLEGGWEKSTSVERSLLEVRV